jgi:hypothetical protein
VPNNDQNHPVVAKRFLLLETPDRKLGCIFLFVSLVIAKPARDRNRVLSVVQHRNKTNPLML